MATKEKALRYAQDAANREKVPYRIAQSRNGQWLYGPLKEPAGLKEFVVYPKEKAK